MRDPLPWRELDATAYLQRVRSLVEQPRRSWSSIAACSVRANHDALTIGAQRATSCSIEAIGQRAAAFAMLVNDVGNYSGSLLVPAPLFDRARPRRPRPRARARLILRLLFDKLVGASQQRC